MPNNPLVSVCVAVYNRENFIRPAIESVLAQTYQNFEIIIIDDGSTDKTISVINAIKDSRIKLFKNDQNRGVVYTRNRYLNIAKGEYVAILDSDDLWLPTKLKEQLSFFKNHPKLGICGTNAIRKYSNGTEVLWKYPSEDEGIRIRLLWGSSIVHSSMIVKNSILKENNIKYSTKLNSAEDYDFIRQVITKTKASNINKELVIYNIHNEQLSELENTEQIDSSIAIVQLYLKDLGVHVPAGLINIYKKIFTFKFKLNIDELLLVKGLFETIKKANYDSKFTTHEKLTENLSYRWFLTCYYSSQNGLNVIKIFDSGQTEFPYEMSLSQKIKFYLKCFLKK